MGLSEHEKKQLQQIDDDLTGTDPGLAAIMNDPAELKRRDDREDKKMLMIAILASVIGILLVLLVLGLFLVYVRFNPIHLPDGPYMGRGY